MAVHKIHFLYFLFQFLLLFSFTEDQIYDKVWANTRLLGYIKNKTNKNIMSNRMCLCNRVHSTRAKLTHWQFSWQMSHLTLSTRPQKICFHNTCNFCHARSWETLQSTLSVEISHRDLETDFQLPGGLAFPDLNVLASCVQQLENITEAPSQEGVPKTYSSFRWQWQKTRNAPWRQPPAKLYFLSGSQSSGPPAL